ncbi:MAG: hypothetical protein ACFCGT_15080 [Sandaracinaceae bacterium]
MDPGSFLQGRSRETAIHRDRTGRWFNDGVEITHPGLVAAFDAWLKPAPDGSRRYCLSNDINWAYVEIQGPPRFVRRVEVTEAGMLLTLSDGTRTPLDTDSLRQGPDGALYCDVPGDMTACFDRHAQQSLDPLVEEDERGVFLRIGGRKVRPPTVP